MATKRKTAIKAEQSRENVFADLGIPHPEQELLKAKLALQIYRLIKTRGLTQAEAGRILGIKQPHVSPLMRNRAGAFSVERLIEFLTALGQEVEITVKPSCKEHGFAVFSGSILLEDYRGWNRSLGRCSMTRLRFRLRRPQMLSVSGQTGLQWMCFGTSFSR